MDFWSVYFEESLGSPWVVQSQTREEFVSSTPSADWVFVTFPVGEHLKAMMDRMVCALGYETYEVDFYNTSDTSLGFLEAWGEPKKVFIFGNQFSPCLGQPMDWYGHKIMVTHSLEVLEKTPRLKGETWSHLKAFLGK